MSDRQPLTRAEAGRLGARARWGPQVRVLRLDHLDPVAADVIRAAWAAADDAAQREAAAALAPATAPKPEARRDRDEHPSAA